MPIQQIPDMYDRPTMRNFCYRLYIGSYLPIEGEFSSILYLGKQILPVQWGDPPDRGPIWWAQVVGRWILSGTYKPNDAPSYLWMTHTGSLTFYWLWSAGEISGLSCLCSSACHIWLRSYLPLMNTITSVDACMWNLGLSDHNRYANSVHSRGIFPVHIPYHPHERDFSST